MRARRLGTGEEDIATAARALRAGRLVAFPTETVYGLGAIATDDRAVASIFAAKRRPRFNPLIVHVASRDAAMPLASWNEAAERLAARFWPGPLTLVLPRPPDSPLSLLVSAGLDTVALRLPAHGLAQRLLAATGLPVAAPSANRAGEVSPTTADHVAKTLGERIDLILDGGPCPIGLESTVVDLTGATPRLLRPGGLVRRRIEAEIGRIEAAPRRAREGEAALSPGQQSSHYAPARPVRLDASTVAPDEALLAFGPRPLAGAAVTLNLSPHADLEEAAANLFAMLRALDRPDVRAIAVMPIPRQDLGEAICDRLVRAAAPRPAGTQPAERR
ncbi:MAG TPA: L-threonylcarbamoyladenylate synthase [Geminicoccaceae bacterium]|nr:L-threonylcarbamoyladenylate synthase [Geminicoccaceae bacterium]